MCISFNDKSLFMAHEIQPDCTLKTEEYVLYGAEDNLETELDVSWSWPHSYQQSTGDLNYSDIHSMLAEELSPISSNLEGRLIHFNSSSAQSSAPPGYSNDICGDKQQRKDSVLEFLRPYKGNQTFSDQEQ